MDTLDSRRLHRPSPASGFTRVDAVATLGTVALFALLLFPARANQQLRSHAALCQANLGRLQTAWTQFAGDNQGALPLVPSGNIFGWVQGWLDFSSSPANTNTLYLTDGRYAQLGPYTSDARLYRCPSDPTTVRIGSNVWPRIRSYAANCAMNGDNNFIASNYRLFRRLSDVIDPPPSRAWVYMDEHPDSINDGYFAVSLPNPGTWVDWPGSYHDRAVSLSFADGHVELHRWMDPRTLIPNRRTFPGNTSHPDSQDITWLISRTSSPR